MAKTLTICIYGFSKEILFKIFQEIPSRYRANGKHTKQFEPLLFLDPGPSVEPSQYLDVIRYY